ncbi:DUF1764-domain-containing protein [Leucogyrophana mollusca]|uniref:DUF1764-domain-containing protein n=1 Tax=Leucogyrophana mollusca TaxID=85980 RepID=A0ACB8BAH5_9AGAM|nr:DUF1764-domain-containing protein [Leucogyrophana mollusca]
MSISEIDAIFASKGKARAIESIASSSSLADQSQKKKKKKKDKKPKAPADTEVDGVAPSTDQVKAGKKRPLPETVVDPSAQISAAKAVKRPKVEASSIVRQKKSTKEKAKDDEERFKDSRGNGPRRKTEDGFNIYKEDELGIGNEGGDTPLCPFDCDCCF